MKVLFASLLLLPYAQLKAQQTHPVIKATSPIVDIRDGDDFRKGHWVVSPQLKPDVYPADRYKGIKTVAFYTDFDSTSLVVEPNRTYNFAILLGKDTAHTQVSTQLPSPLPLQRNCTGCSSSDTIPFTFGRGNKIYLKGSINHSPPLDLMFDLGSNQVVISKNGLAKGTNIQWNETKENVSFGGNNTVQSSRQNTISLGNLRWEDVPVVSVAEADGDGIIGYNIFDGRVIEIDYDHKRLIVHYKGFNAGVDYQPMALRFKGGLPFIEATLINGSNVYKDYFEFDGGSNGSLWLNQAFATRHQLYESLKTIGETKSHGLGGSIHNQTVLMPKIMIGKYELSQVPVDLERPSTQQHLSWGIFGMDILKRFNVIIDFTKDSLYLKPNRFINEPYRKPVNKSLLLAYGAVLTVALIAGFVYWRNTKKSQHCC